ncbi:hypothetical protein ACEQPO_00410 [Bacillus sp. SL00103]
MLIVFRIGAFHPAPNVNAEVLQAAGSNECFRDPQHVWGRGTFQFSILAMGIMPYITASIIIQLLQMDVVPKFTEWSKQGEVGRRKISTIHKVFYNCSRFYPGVRNVIWIQQYGRRHAD